MIQTVNLDSNAITVKPSSELPQEDGFAGMLAGLVVGTPQSRMAPPAAPKTSAPTTPQHANRETMKARQERLRSDQARSERLRSDQARTDKPRIEQPQASRPEDPLDDARAADQAPADATTTPEVEAQPAEETAPQKGMARTESGDAKAATPESLSDKPCQTPTPAAEISEPPALPIALALPVAANMPAPAELGSPAKASDPRVVEPGPSLADAAPGTPGPSAAVTMAAPEGPQTQAAPPDTLTAQAQENESQAARSGSAAGIFPTDGAATAPREPIATAGERDGSASQKTASAPIAVQLTSEQKAMRELASGPKPDIQVPVPLQERSPLTLKDAGTRHDTGRDAKPQGPKAPESAAPAAQKEAKASAEPQVFPTRHDAPLPQAAPKGSVSTLQALGGAATTKVDGLEISGRASATSSLRSPTPVAQMEGTIRWMLKNADQRAELQLHPESLGKVMISLKMEGREVHAKVWASEPSTVPLLQEHKAFLEASLREQGLTLGSFDLQQGQHGQGAQNPAQGNSLDLPAPDFTESPELRQETPTPLATATADPHQLEMLA